MAFSAIYLRVGRFRIAVPSGAFTGIQEAVEPRDGDKNTYFSEGDVPVLFRQHFILSPVY